MKKKKCITLIGCILFFNMVIASIVLCPIGVSSVDAAEQNGSKNIIQGDVNNDGSVNSIDFAHMRMNLLGIEGNVITEEKVLLADLNMDKKFDSIDLGVMRGYLLGKISGFSDDTSARTTLLKYNLATTKSVPSPSPSPSPTKALDGDDFTNSISKASYFVKVGEEVSGKINFSGDKDFLIFEPPVDGDYRVDVFTKLDSTIGYLYVEKVEGLNYYYSSFKTYVSDESCYIEQYLSAGTKYYLGIKNKSSVASLDSYSIKISKQ